MDGEAGVERGQCDVQQTPLATDAGDLRGHRGQTLWRGAGVERGQCDVQQPVSEKWPVSDVFWIYKFCSVKTVTVKKEFF